MGTSHFSSNVVAGGKTITASSVTATTFTGNTSVTAPTITGSTLVTAPTIHSSGHFKIGNHQYILIGSAGVAATVVAAATAVDASCKGSLYLSTAGNAWFLTSDTAATKL